MTKGKNRKKKLNRAKAKKEIDKLVEIRLKINDLYALRREAEQNRLSLYGIPIIVTKPTKKNSQVSKAYKDQERFLSRDA